MQPWSNKRLLFFYIPTFRCWRDVLSFYRTKRSRNLPKFVMNWLPKWGRASRPFDRVLSKPQRDSRTMTGQQCKDRGARLKGSLLFFLFLMDRTMNQLNKRISHYWRLHLNWSPFDWEDTLDSGCNYFLFILIYLMYTNLPVLRVLWKYSLLVETFLKSV